MEKTISIDTQNGKIPVYIAKKKGIKNINLYVKPLDGRVSVTAPHNSDTERIRAFVESKSAWIEKQLRKAAEYEKIKENRLTYESGERIRIFGREYVVERKESQRPNIRTEGDRLIYGMPENIESEKKQEYFEKWQAERLKAEAKERIAYWEARTGLKCSGWAVGRMHKRWGSCNVKTKKIRLSIMLTFESPDFLDYVIVHELAHLVSKYHDNKFYDMVERFIPGAKAEFAKGPRRPKR
ncbi:MAG: M48 family metallopeptidase [Clostridiales bacterium]|jgi:predicted metal-dependent hydrolase|nr:M48 family metallopeptidase [Clostridiales bacterium]